MENVTYIGGCLNDNSIAAGVIILYILTHRRYIINNLPILSYEFITLGGAPYYLKIFYCRLYNYTNKTFIYSSTYAHLFSFICNFLLFYANSSTVVIFTTIIMVISAATSNITVRFPAAVQKYYFSPVAWR